MIRQNCFGRSSPASRRVSARSRVPSPPARMMPEYALIARPLLSAVHPHCIPTLHELSSCTRSARRRPSPDAETSRPMAPWQALDRDAMRPWAYERLVSEMGGVADHEHLGP